MIPIHVSPYTIPPLNKYQYLHYNSNVNFNETHLKVLDLTPREYNNTIYMKQQVLDRIREMNPDYVIFPKMSFEKLNEISCEKINNARIVFPVLYMEQFNDAMNNDNVDIILLHKHMIYKDRRDIVGNMIRGMFIYNKTIWLDEILEDEREIVVASNEVIITHILTDIVYSFARIGRLISFDNIKINRTSFSFDESFNEDYRPILAYNQVYVECICSGLKPPSFTQFLKGEI